jgi:iron(III) transport system ATP-binding protein
MIALRDIACRYGSIEALSGVSIEIGAGESLAVAGPSGSGKTTLLRLIAGLQSPDRGEIELDGVVVSGPGIMLPPHRRAVGMAFQQPALWPHMTVAGNIGFPIGTWSRHERAARVQELLATMELTHLALRRPAEISGGEARRVALARALAARPRRLLLDEPLVNLPPDIRRRLLRYALEEAAAWGSGVVLVTHDQREAHGLCSRTAVLRAGRLEEVSSQTQTATGHPDQSE